MLAPRDRVLCALNHEEPDRVPIFFGTSGVTTMLGAAYDRLKAYLGLSGETRVFWRALQYALIDEEVLRRFGSDGRPLIAGPAPSTLERELPDDSFIDGWGIGWQRLPGATYYEIANPPLKNATIDDLDRYAWPELAHPGRFVGMAARAKAIRDAGYAVVALSGVSPFEYCYMLRGVETWFTDLAGDPDFAQALLRKVTDLQRLSVARLLEEAGEYIDVLITGDDLGGQDAPLISPAMYRRLVKPFHAELYDTIKAKTKARIFYHSDGSILSLLDDLCEVGIDILNPVQVSTNEMSDTASLKRRYGNRLSYCGGIDTQWVLPHGATADVRQEVRRRIKDLGPGGGYILASVHCIQPDVPPQNVCAMFDEALAAGRYPLAL